MKWSRKDRIFMVFCLVLIVISAICIFPRKRGDVKVVSIETETETFEIQSQIEVETEAEPETETEVFIQVETAEIDGNELDIEYPDEEDIAEDDGGYIGCFELTAYCACEYCCGEGAMGITASGTVPYQGRTVACNSIPLGTEIYIDGFGYYTVEDRGGMGDDVIDIFFYDHYEALELGRVYGVDVYYAQ